MVTWALLAADMPLVAVVAAIGAAREAVAFVGVQPALAGLQSQDPPRGVRRGIGLLATLWTTVHACLRGAWRAWSWGEGERNFILV